LAAKRALAETTTKSLKKVLGWLGEPSGQKPRKYKRR
jgi:hypothetical protein